VLLRPAEDTDAAAIRRIIRQAGISPFDLDWHHFLVADVGGNLVGTAQIKTHHDGTRELASIAVVPHWRKHGVASRLIQALLVEESGQVFLICQTRLETFYQRFGFQTVPPEKHPASLHRIYRLMNIVFGLVERLGRAQFRLIVMRRSPQESR
jgi:N-acetylglutamate synthase-like GNAT family acetyltransferase